MRQWYKDLFVVSGSKCICSSFSSSAFVLFLLSMGLICQTSVVPNEVYVNVSFMCC